MLNNLHESKRSVNQDAKKGEKSKTKKARVLSIK